jgi:hypothetical protein
MKNAAREKSIEKFLNYLIEGLTQRQAYYKAFPQSKKWKETTVDSKASDLLVKEKVRERYNEKKTLFEEELKKVQIEEEKNSMMTRIELLRLLKKGAYMAVGDEETPIALKERKPYQNESTGEFVEGCFREEIVEAAGKNADLRALSSISGTIAKLEGWVIDKMEHTGGIDIKIVKVKK